MHAELDADSESTPGIGRVIEQREEGCGRRVGYVDVGLAAPLHGVKAYLSPGNGDAQLGAHLDHEGLVERRQNGIGYPIAPEDAQPCRERCRRVLGSAGAHGKTCDPGKYPNYCTDSHLRGLLRVEHGFAWGTGKATVARIRVGAEA